MNEDQLIKLVNDNYKCICNLSPSESIYLNNDIEIYHYEYDDVIVLKDSNDEELYSLLIDLDNEFIILECL